MTNDLQNRRDILIEAALKHMAFDGWSNSALIQGAIDAGMPENMVLRVFPNGMNEAIEHFADWSDRRMVAALEPQGLDVMKVRDRIHKCIKTRIEMNAPHKEAIRRLLSYLAFLDRRISDVLKTFGVPYQLKSMLSRLPNPFSLRARL